MKPPLRLGVVGSGGMAARRLRAFAGLEGCRVTALAARNAATGEPLARQYGVSLSGDWRELVAGGEVDAVVVCTSNDSHGTIALAALEADKPVFTEYPLARSLEEAESVVRAAREKDLVVRVAHDEAACGEQEWLRRQVAALGPLQLAEFARATPGRGARPEVLFNLKVSGPPMLFFIYHVYPLVDLFGPAAWVQAHAEYAGLDRDSGRYRSFVNTLTAGFESGGAAVWTWAGGVEAAQAEQRRRLILAAGSLAAADEGWTLSSRAGSRTVQPPEVEKPSLESRFAAEAAGEPSVWKADLQLALEAVRISLQGEVSAREGRRVVLS